MRRNRAGARFASLGLLLGSFVPAQAAPPEVGATVPDLELPTLSGSQRMLSERDAPTVLVFFRGAW